jgi:hypothetical protein
LDPNTFYEFNGCFFHGCQECYDLEEIHDRAQNVIIKRQIEFEKRNIIELLKKSSIPEKKWFYNELNKTKLSDCNHFKIKSNYDNRFELLKFYNNKACYRSN